MPPKLNASQVERPESKETPTRRITDPEDKWTDAGTGTLWKTVSPDRIKELLGKSPDQCSTVKKLGLLDTFSIDYPRPDWPKVKAYILNFDEERGCSVVEGRKLLFNVDVLRDAFKLPAGDPSIHKAHWKGPEIDFLFKKNKERGGKYCLDWLAESYKHWEGPLRVVTELLLGRKRPSSVTGKIVWYFCCYLWEDMPNCKKPAVMPDWAALMHEDLKNEVGAMKEHLNNGKAKPKNGKPPKNQPFYGSSAIMHLILYSLREPGTAPILKSVEIRGRSGTNAEESVQADLERSADPVEHPGASQDIQNRKRRAEKNADLACSAVSAEHPSASQDIRIKRRRTRRADGNASLGRSANSAEEPVETTERKASIGRSAASAKQSVKTDGGDASNDDSVVAVVIGDRGADSVPHNQDLGTRISNLEGEENRKLKDDADSVACQERESLQQAVEKANKDAAEARAQVLQLQEEKAKGEQNANDAVEKAKKDAAEARAQVLQLQEEKAQGEQNTNDAVEKAKKDAAEARAQVLQLQEEKAQGEQNASDAVEKAKKDAEEARAQVLQLQEEKAQGEQNVIEALEKAHKEELENVRKEAQQEGKAQGEQNAIEALEKAHKEELENVRKEAQLRFTQAQEYLREKCELNAQLDASKAEVQLVVQQKAGAEAERDEACNKAKLSSEQHDETLRSLQLELDEKDTQLQELELNRNELQEAHRDVERQRIQLQQLRLEQDNLTQLYGNLLDIKCTEDMLAKEKEEKPQKVVRKEDKAQTSQLTSPASRVISRPDRQEEEKASSQSSDDEHAFTANFRMAGDNYPTINMSGSDLVDVKEPPQGHLRVVPKEHQQKGLAWMVKRESEDTPSPQGGILADDQGMGKTLQAIMLILTNRPARPKPCSTLVICPLAVLHQWAEEINKMCTSKAELKVLKYHGPDRQKPSCPEFSKFDVVVTPYSVLETESDKHHRKPTQASHKESKLCSMNWHRVILDEAHKIKNRNAKVSNACFKVKAKNRWCLTGTLVQNSVEDLFSFFHFVRYDKIMNYHDQFRPIAIVCKRDIARGVAELRCHLEPFTLRRMKDILNLPPKIHKLIEVEFAEESHRQVYESIAQESSQVWQQERAKGGKKTSATLALLLKAHMACDDPKLPTFASRMYASRVELKDRIELQDRLNKIDILSGKCDACQEEHSTGVVYLSKTCPHVYCENCHGDFSLNEETKCRVHLCFKEAVLISSEAIAPMTGVKHSGSSSHDKHSSKLLAVQKYIEDLPPLPDLSKGKSISKAHTEKVIVFSQWTSALTLLQNLLNDLGVKYARVDGNMHINERQAALKAFNNNPQIQVLLISLMAGCCGLNITAANHVIILDGWWNPTVEDQAVDRCHRIGQTKAVTVVRIVVKGTIEMRILELQAKKRKLATAIFSSDPNGHPDLDNTNERSDAEEKRSDVAFLMANWK